MNQTGFPVRERLDQPMRLIPLALFCQVQGFDVINRHFTFLQDAELFHAHPIPAKDMRERRLV